MLRHTLFFCLFLLNICASSQVLTLRASLPGTLIDGLPVNAGGELFYLGGSPSTYCPPELQKFCPNSTETILTPGLESLFVEVPGSQQVYVKNNGLLSFAQAHAEVDPNGAYFGGWTNYTYVYEDDVSAPITVLTWASAASEGVFACGIHNAPGETVYIIYANTPAFDQTEGCTQLDGLLPTYLPGDEGAGAWGYV